MAAPRRDLRQRHQCRNEPDPDGLQARYSRCLARQARRDVPPAFGHDHRADLHRCGRAHRSADRAGRNARAFGPADAHSRWHAGAVLRRAAARQPLPHRYRGNAERGDPGQGQGVPRCVVPARQRGDRGGRRCRSAGADRAYQAVVRHMEGDRKASAPARIRRAQGPCRQRSRQSGGRRQGHGRARPAARVQLCGAASVASGPRYDRLQSGPDDRPARPGDHQPPA